MFVDYCAKGRPRAHMLAMAMTHSTTLEEDHPHTWPFGIGLRALLLDALWIVFLFGASSAPYPLGVTNVERYFWFPADLVVVVVAIAHKGEFLRLARRHTIFLTWPMLASISMIWSLTPWTSLYHGIQLFMTIMVGLLLCYYASLERILQLLFAALSVSAVLSVVYTLANGQLGAEWQGVFPHKNVLGHMMCLLIITGLCLFLTGWRPLVAVSGIFGALVLLFLSRSGTAFIALAVALCVLPFVISLRTGFLPLALTIGLALIAIATSLLVVEVMDVHLFQAVLSSLGKDETLTGRTILWEYGVEAFNSRPWLGFGYKAYWDSSETSATLLRTVIGQELWFFHNNFMDVAVAFGFIGPVLLAAGLLTALFASVKRGAQSRGSAALWPVSYVAFVAVLTTAENPLFQNHSLHQLLLIVVAAADAQCDRLIGRA
jgi:exopolysaccharide production protein ExoQ